MTAVLDCTDYSISKLHCDNSRIHIAHSADRGINQDASQNKDLFHFTSDQETGHIEVMDRHVQEEATGDSNIFNWRRLGIAADEMKQLWATNLTTFHCLAHTTIISIKSPVEADL